MTVSIRRALISVSDKTGVADFARGLSALGVEIVSTGGTARTLREAGLPVRDVSEITGFPEVMDGRVKTLHPRVHGGILYVRGNPEHEAVLREQSMAPIDLVCVNLYPFVQTVSKPGVTVEDAIENIDIGGPSMIRAAAKNHAHVAVVVDSADYQAVLDEIKAGGSVSEGTRTRLAVKAFGHTAEYDAAIYHWVSSNLLGDEQETSEGLFPETLDLHYERVQTLRYGENPHQSAAFYRKPDFNGISLGRARQLGGKELSYNNIMDLDGALGAVLEFQEPACVIVKHTNPCGLAVRDSAAEAFAAAREGDPISAFGGIIALNRPVDLATAEQITGPNTFFEAVIAPGFHEDALEMLKTKKKWGANLRLLELEMHSGQRDPMTGRFVAGGVLMQDSDLADHDPAELRTVTKREPSPEEMEDLLFAWKVVKHVKSNAIVLAKNKMLIGVGAGQMNRVGSVKIAAEHAGERAAGSVLASDAFFPKPDGPETAAKAGVTAIIQPGGSVEDPNTIAVADQYGMAMVFTKMRHFKH